MLLKALLLVLAAAIALALLDPFGWLAATAAPATHVGAAACARCHEREHEAWRGSHHDLAIQEPGPDSVLGDFDGAEIDHFGDRTAFTLRDGSYFVTTAGADGTVREHRVRYTFGATPLQQYLVDGEGGALQALSVCWDARPAEDGGQRWFHLYPDEPIPPGDELHWSGALQRWNKMCADCHSTALRKGYDAATGTYHTAFAELDVGCEACHGPGSRHVAWADGEGGERELAFGRGQAAGWAWIGDAATATRTPARTEHRELDGCARCHSRRTPLVEAPGPGAAFLDAHRPALLDEHLYEADGQIRDEVYVWGSFVQSKMHRAGVTCSDCHEPHALALRAPDNALCTRCHRAGVFDAEAHHHHRPGTAGAFCVDCHMPRKTYMVVDPRRDHSLRVPRPDLTVELGTPNACSGCHNDRPAEWARDAVAGWGVRPGPHFAAALHLARRGRAGAPAALRALARDAEQPAIARATALSLLARHPGPATAAAVRSALDAGDPLVRLGAALAADALTARERLELLPALRDPVRAVRTELARALAGLPRGQLGALAADLDAALAELRASRLLNADWPWAWLDLGVLAWSSADRAGAEAAFRRALELDPRSVEARVNLADLHRAQGRDDLGERVLRDGLSLRDDAAALHHALGLLLARRQRLPEALAELERAADLAPDEPHYAYAFAVGLHSAGRADLAIARLERTLRSHPDDAEVLHGLACFLRDRGDLRPALDHARRLVSIAPDFEGGPALVAELEARLR